MMNCNNKERRKDARVFANSSLNARHTFLVVNDVVMKEVLHYLATDQKTQRQPGKILVCVDKN